MRSETGRVGLRAHFYRVLPLVMLVLFFSCVVGANANAGTTTPSAVRATYVYDAALNSSASTVVAVAYPHDQPRTRRLPRPVVEPSTVRPVFVAADTAADIGPGIDKSFQFGGAGRSGAGVKNFVGPQSSVVRGASQGRVFVTDDQGRVVLDITRDRVKPVVPGQGFVAGDGWKLAPTQQQLDWIDQLWGN